MATYIHANNKSNKNHNRGADVMHRLDNKKYGYFALVGILITLVLIIYGFYGFTSFLTGIEDKEVAALLLVTLIVGIILVMLQRAGIIFAGKQFY
jgi:CBS domain containing-hemolysin-like protein